MVDYNAHTHALVHCIAPQRLMWDKVSMLGHSVSLPVILGLVQQLHKSHDHQQLHNTPQHPHVVFHCRCEAMQCTNICVSV